MRFVFLPDLITHELVKGAAVVFSRSELLLNLHFIYATQQPPIQPAVKCGVTV